VRREIRASAANRVFVNGGLVPLGALRRLLADQVAVHGQSTHLTLASREAQRGFLDAALLPDGLKDRLAQAWLTLQQSGQRLDRNTAEAGERLRRREQLDAIRRAIDEVSPLPGEEAALVEEAARLARIDEWRQALAEATELLGEGEADVISGLGRARRLLERHAATAPGAAQALAHLAAAEEAAREAAGWVAGLADEAAGEAGPRLDAVQARLADLQRLRRVQRAPDLEALLAAAEAARAEIEELDRRQEEGLGLDREVEARARDFHVLASRAGEARRRGAADLAARVESEMRELALAGARFRVAFDGDAPPSADAQAVRAAGGPGGYGSVEFRFAAHGGEEPLPLARVASGGELARLMLALALVGDRDGADGGLTVIYDEVDAGIGGATAEKVAERLAREARRHQVICVTHLPQIAARADHHLRVSKLTSRGRGATQVDVLTPSSRIEELARMLGAGQAPETARRHAEALLGLAPAAPGPSPRTTRKRTSGGRAAPRP
jgi:DNA repair protein RecN (Recombination protein N)